MKPASAGQRHRPWLAWLLAAGACLAYAAAIVAQTDGRALDTVDVTADEGQAQVVLRWERVIEFTQRRDRNALVLQFDAPLAPEPLAKLPDRLPAWLTDLRYGYDSMLVVPAPNVKVSASGDGKVVTILFEPAPAPDQTAARRADRSIDADPDVESGARSPAASDNLSTDAQGSGSETADGDAIDGEIQDVEIVEIQDDGSARRLARLRAVLRADMGDIVGAIAELRGLAARYQDDVGMVVTLAELETRLERWREAVAAYDKALALAPNSPRLIQAKAALLREFGSRFSVSSDLASVTDQDDQLTTLIQGRVSLADLMEFDMELERREVDSPAITRLSGEQASFKGVRHRGRLSLSAAVADLGRARASVYAGPESLGAGLRFSRASNYGHSELDLDWREPYFGLVVGIADGATVSRARVSHRKRLSERLELRASAGFNNYGIGSEDSAVKSWEAGFSVGYLLRRAEPFLNLSYRLETEHTFDEKTRNDAAGQPFELLPIDSTEAHVLELQWDERLTDYLRTSGQVGYALDRLGAKGPVLDVSVTYEPHPTLSLGVRAGTSVTSSRGDDAQTLRVGAFLNLRL